MQELTFETTLALVIAKDSRYPRDGRFIEKVGTYNPRVPHDHAARLVLKEERIKHWMGTGAQPSDTLRTLISRAPKPVAVDAAAPAAQ